VELASGDANDSFVIPAQNWHIVKVEPAPGTILDVDSTVVLTCSKRQP
jgi:hypothetical protein